MSATLGKVFVSYSRSDQDYANNLVADLKRRNYEVWIDHEGIGAGATWQAEIERAITNCDVLLLIVSPDSCNSTYVHREISFAEGINKPIVPLLLRGNLCFFVAEKQYYSVQNGNIPDNQFFQRLQLKIDNPESDVDLLGSPTYLSKLRQSHTKIVPLILVTGIVLVIGLLAYFLVFQPRNEDKFRVIFTSFEPQPDLAEISQNTEDYGRIFNDRISRAFEERYSAYDNNIIFETRIIPIIAKDDASLVAYEEDADLVIFGYVSADNVEIVVSPHFYISDQSERTPSEIFGTHQLPSFTVSLDDLTASEQIVDEAVSVTEFAIALYHLTNENFVQARRAIDNAICYTNNSVSNNTVSLESCYNTDLAFENEKIEELYFFGSIIARKLGDFEAAERYIQQAIQIAPDYGRAYLARGNIDYERARSHYHAGNDEQRIPLYENAIINYEAALTVADEIRNEGLFIKEMAHYNLGLSYTRLSEITNDEREDRAYTLEARNYYEAIVQSANETEDNTYFQIILQSAYDRLEDLD